MRKRPAGEINLPIVLIVEDEFFVRCELCGLRARSWICCGRSVERKAGPGGLSCQNGGMRSDYGYSTGGSDQRLGFGGSLSRGAERYARHLYIWQWQQPRPLSPQQLVLRQALSTERSRRSLQATHVRSSERKS